MNLSQIQNELKAPKGQDNKFGGYKYRSCEDIVEAVKPILLTADLSLLLSDEIVCVSDRIYVKATAMLVDSEGKVKHTVCAFAREPLERKGMDASQITGAASSYARKYALNGLFAIDDTKDADSYEAPKKEKSINKRQLSELEEMINQTGTDKESLLVLWELTDLSKMPENSFNGRMGALRRKLPKSDEK